jgi:hypothetical protein
VTVVLLAGGITACGNGAPAADSYLARRAAFEPELIYAARASLVADDTLPHLAPLFPGVPGTFERIQYPSGEMMLDGWLFRPPRDPKRLSAALL